MSLNNNAPGVQNEKRIKKPIDKAGTLLYNVPKCTRRYKTSDRSSVWEAFHNESNITERNAD